MKWSATEFVILQNSKALLLGFISAVIKSKYFFIPNAQSLHYIQLLSLMCEADYIVVLRLQRYLMVMYALKLAKEGLLMQDSTWPS